jgi:hypothetical protein
LGPKPRRRENTLEGKMSRGELTGAHFWIYKFA